MFNVVGRAKLLFLAVFIFILGGLNAGYGQDNTVWVWYGPPDDTLDAKINDTLYVDVYVKTSSNTYVENMLLVMGFNDQYIDTSISESEGSSYYPITEWGMAGFYSPEGSPPNPSGWSSQSFNGWARFINPNAPLLHVGIFWKVLTMVVITANNHNLLGQTVNALGPGLNGVQGSSNAGDSLGEISYEVIEYFSPVHFIQEVGHVSGTVTGDIGDPIEDVIITASGTIDTATTDSEGNYGLELGVGTYDITFSHPGYYDTTITDVIIYLDSTTVKDVIMNPIPGGYISGTVADTLGILIEGVIVADLDGIDTYTTDFLGYYILGLPQGVYSISFTHDNYQDTTVNNVNVTVGDTADLNMVMISGIDYPDDTPNIIDVHQNYPNPFNQGTIIEFELDRPAFVTVEIFDILGRKVAIVDSFLGQAGLNHVSWHSNGNASGIYFCRVRSSQSDDTRAMLLIK